MMDDVTVSDFSIVNVFGSTNDQVFSDMETGNSKFAEIFSNISDVLDRAHFTGCLVVWLGKREYQELGQHKDMVETTKNYQIIFHQKAFDWELLLEDAEWLV